MSDTAQIALTADQIDQAELTDNLTVPPGIELLKERLKTGMSYAKLGEKYQCSHVNVITR